MSANSAELPSMPVAARAAWTRLALLAAMLVAALAFIALVFVWLVPSNGPSRTVTYALANLEVGVPKFFRPLDMGWDAAGEQHGIWLVRSSDGGVSAWWSKPAHPVACAVQPAAVDLPGRYTGDVSALTPAPPAATGVRSQPPWLGFREPCLGGYFLSDGTHFGGPVPRGLDRFPTTIEGDRVTIDLRTVILGACGSSRWTGCSEPEHQRTARSRFPVPIYDLR